MIKYLRTVVIAVLAVAAVSCSGPGEVHEYAVGDLEFTLEGPLFAGPNSGQAEIIVDLKEILGDAYSEDMRISDVSKSSAFQQYMMALFTMRKRPRLQFLQTKVFTSASAVAKVVILSILSWNTNNSPILMLSAI